MNSEESKAFGLGQQDDEPETPKGKGKKRKAGSAKKGTPSKKKKEDVREQSSLLSGGTLKDFQRVGVDWLINRHMNTSVRWRRVIRLGCGG